ncbi:MFS transporter [Chania multitudinisentens RB-25]|uniref:Bcr/CflA family efflux transporter n=1 Tax=Chania multitudinisentens RB-25 TaxID=1441930 RepID=W0LBC5_9GAMM|nr:multidrug effflux MFS transporter [Chania multitudinisentens]AHG21016.2 MFS transporter [Chania multitudinisentens RB-25]
MTNVTVQNSGGESASPSRYRDLRILVILSALMSFASISTDLYLPAMPTIANDLHAAHGRIEFTLSGFLIGFSLGQLFWGPIGDRYGRRIPIAIGMGLFMLGAAGCALAHSIEQMVGWRVVQAAGACAGPVLARAMVRDLYTRERSAQMLSTLFLFMAVAPLAGPILGGQILAISSWQAIFWTMAGLGFLALFGTFALPETLSSSARNEGAFAAIFSGYFKLLFNPRIMGYAIASTFYYGGFYAFIAGTPFVYIEYFHISPQAYGLLFGVNILGVMSANFINSKLVAKLGCESLFHAGSAMAAIAGIMMALNAYLGWFGLAGIAIPFFFYAAMNGFIVANSVAGALAEVTRNAGMCSSLIGAMQYGSGIFSAALVGWLNDGTPWTMSSMIGLCSIGCLIASLLLKRRYAGS